MNYFCSFLLMKEKRHIGWRGGKLAKNICRPNDVDWSIQVKITYFLAKKLLAGISDLLHFSVIFLRNNWYPLSPKQTKPPQQTTATKQTKTNSESTKKNMKDQFHCKVTEAMFSAHEEEDVACNKFKGSYTLSIENSMPHQKWQNDMAQH